ncbi:MAG: cob(I)yrinic acid a,c-diamide adenosyltransferase [Desulfomonile tiedjei]|nr:cob(I)yrinic acid a,c-diamide adenosyltransferase [Desulfomonile tiedjei]
MKKGLFIIVTGRVKEVTAPALGTMFRALGRGFGVCLVQFAKGNGETADAIATNWSHPRLEIHRLGEKLETESGAVEEKTQAVREVWRFTEQLISSGKFQVVVLDKLTDILKTGLVAAEEIVASLRSRPEDVHVIVTGNDVPEPLIAAADLVTEAVEVK